MSDPVTNVEIEDVLSSIRRLVSVEDRESAQADDADSAADAAKEASVDDQPPLDLGSVGKPVEDAADARPDRLVLTAALRVDDIAQDPADGAEAEPDTDTGPTEPASDDTAFDHDEPTGSDNAWAEDTSTFDDPEDAPTLADDQTSDSATNAWDAGDHRVDHDHHVDQAPTDDDDDDSSFEDPVFDVPQDTLAARVAELQAVVAAQDDDWEADDGEDGDHGTVIEMPWEAHMPDEPSDVYEDDDEAPMSDMDDAEGPHDMADVVAFADVEDAELVEDDSGDDTVHAARDVIDDTETEDTAWTDDEDDADTAEAFRDDDDSAILDEEALRDLVSEIVRQELQGTLGERITRNVRKLVRREIHRALASQEHD